MIRAALLVLLVACSDPPLKIVYRVQEAGSYACSAASCSDIHMSCDTVLQLRVLSPKDPNVPPISICQEVNPDKDRTLCSIGGIDLKPTTLPRETLEVQVLVWPKEAVQDANGDLDCSKPGPVDFDANDGFPVAANGVNPAFGGRAFYHPGDSETVVTLGCTNERSVNLGSCSGADELQVTTSVQDFGNYPLSVGPKTGDALTVEIGIPEQVNDGFLFNSGNAVALPRTVVQPTPAWGGPVDLPITSSSCIQVTEDTAETTSTLHCDATLPKDMKLDIFGVRVPKKSLDDIVHAIGQTQFPGQGLTLGIVIDQNNLPAAGAIITVDPPYTIQYINAARTGIVPNGTQTTASGLFVSQDAPYNTFFNATLVTGLQPKIGGLVAGKLTFVSFEVGAIGQ